MVTGTRKKYNAALEHYKRMKESITDPHQFQTYLGAFLSESRSVTFVMQTENAHKSGFKEWYSKKQEMMEQDPIFPFFNEKRRISVHEKPIETVSSPAICLRWNEIDQPCESTDQKTEKKINLTATQITSRFFEDLPENYTKKGVISLCKEYITKLGLLVDECEAKFP